MLLMTSFYIFIFKGREVGGDYVPLRAVLQSRITAGRWPLQRTTAHRRDLAKGDRVVFYGAAKSHPQDPEAGSFIACAAVGGSFFPVQSGGAQSYRDRVLSGGAAAVDPLLPGPPEFPYAVSIEQAEWFDRPVPIRPLIDSLHFIGDPGRWGAYLQGGIRRIDKEDYERITAAQRSC